MKHGLARHDGFARRRAGRVAHRTAAVLVLGCFLASGPMRAEEKSAVEPTPASPAPTAAPSPGPTAAASAEPAPALPPAAFTATPGAAANPALDVRTPAPEPAKPSLLRRWWFWTAVGVAVGATAAIVIISTRGHAPPATDLGNQEFQP